jgi:hypothetical protein
MVVLRVNGGRENLKSSINDIYIHFRRFVEVPAQEYRKGGMSKARAAARLQKGRPIEIFGEFVPPGEAMAALNDKCRSVAKYRQEYRQSAQAIVISVARLQSGSPISGICATRSSINDDSNTE